VDSGIGMLAVSADSRLLAAGTGSGVRVWDAKSRKELAENLEGHRGQVGRVAVSAGVLATAGDDQTVRVWDPATGTQRVKLLHGHWVRAIALSPDGTKLASSSLDDTVRLWDIGTGREIYRLAGHGKLGGRRALAFTSDGKCLLSWGDDFCLRIWNVSNGKALIEHPIRPSGINVPNEDAEPLEREQKFMIMFGEATFSRDGKGFVLNIGQDFYVFDVGTGKELRKIPSDGGHIISMAISPNGKLLLASAWGKPVQTKLADGRTRFSAAKDPPICLWDLSTGERIRQIMLTEGGAGPICFSPDGKVFATGTEKPHGKIRLWDLATGKERLTIDGFGGAARSLAFSPDGKRLISGMSDTTALVWDLTSEY
jgi:WD40 repeat protein